MAGLAMLVKQGLAEDPSSGALHAFRGRRANTLTLNIQKQPVTSRGSVLGIYSDGSQRFGRVSGRTRHDVARVQRPVTLGSESP